MNLPGFEVEEVDRIGFFGFFVDEAFAVFGEKEEAGAECKVDLRGQDFRA